MIVSNEYSVVSNISGSARNRVRVPRRSPWAPIFLTGPSGLPRWYSCAQTPPSRAVSTRSHSDSAFTTAHADAVQAAGDLVAAAAELAAGVEDGVDDLEGVLARPVLADRDAAAVVDDLDGPVLGDRDPDGRGVAGHRLVDRVVDDLPDEVVEAADVGRADVHAGPAPNGLEALEDLDALGGVVGAAGALALPAGAIAHRWRRSRRDLGAAAASARAWRAVGHAAPPISRW